MLREALERIKTMPEGPERDMVLEDLFKAYPQLREVIGQRLGQAQELSDTPMPGGMRAGGQFVADSPLSSLSAGLRQGMGAYGERKQQEKLEELAKQQTRGLKGVAAGGLSGALRGKSNAPVTGGGGIASGGMTPQEIEYIIRAESAGDPNAVSHAGALGLMQVMPATGAEMGYTAEQLRDPRLNREAGTRYANQMYKQFGDLRLANAAYNAGPGRVGKLVKKYGKNYDAIEPYLPSETRGYVKKIDRWRRG